MRERIVEVHCQTSPEALANAQSSSMIIGPCNAAECGQCTVLRMEEKVSSQTKLNSVLSISPVVAKHVECDSIDRLSLIQGMADGLVARVCASWIAARTPEIVYVHQLRDVGRQEIRKVRNLRDRRCSSAITSGRFQDSSSSIPIHS